MVFHQYFGGTAATLIDQHVLQIAQQSCQYPYVGEIDVGRTEMAHHAVAHGVDNIAHHGDGAHDGDGEVDKLGIVARNTLARHGARLLVDAVIVFALGKGKEECQEEGHHDQPSRYDDVGGKTTYQYAYDKAHGNDCHIEDGVLFEADAVCHVHQPVAHQHGADHGQVVAVGETGCDQTGCQCQHHDDVAHSHAHLAGGNGAVALLRVEAVVLHVMDVVETVDAARYEAECNKHPQCL